MKYFVPLGRFCFSLIFLTAGPGHFTSGTIAYAAGRGVPLASVAVPLSGILAILGSASIILGYKAKWGGWFLILFLVPVTLMMHNYWAMTDPAAAATNHIMFMKNL